MEVTIYAEGTPHDRRVIHMGASDHSMVAWTPTGEVTLPVKTIGAKTGDSTYETKQVACATKEDEARAVREFVGEVRSRYLDRARREWVWEWTCPWCLGERGHLDIARCPEDPRKERLGLPASLFIP